MEKITFAVTNYNRTDWLFRSFENYLNDDRVSEILVSDDCSLPELYDQIKKRVEEINSPKIKLHRNLTNQGVYRNKMHSVALASNKWVIVADSDNEYPKEYLDRIYEKVWDKDVIFNPSMALPVFDFSHFSGITFTKENISSYTSYSKIETILNLMNYFVNRESYLSVWDNNHEPIGSDSVYQNYNWLKAGKKIFVMPNLIYSHAVHSGSHYVANAEKSTPMVFDIVEKLKQLK